MDGWQKIYNFRYSDNDRQKNSMHSENENAKPVINYKADMMTVSGKIVFPFVVHFTHHRFHSFTLHI